MRPHAAPGRLLVFARDPVPGQVKTRLIPALGREAATALYWQLLRDTVAAAARVAGVRLELWVDSTAPQPALTELARQHHMSLQTQHGPDLGARMATALARATMHGGDAVLIGSDCPEFDVGHLEAAFAALADHDVVLGPATDGGYVLIGTRAPQPALFHGIPWGTDRVMDATRRRLRNLGLRWHELPTLRDLDEPADLAHFPHLAARAGVATPPGGTA